MAKLSYLLVIITALELCSTHPANKNAKFKKTNGGCSQSLGKNTPKFKLVAPYGNVTLRCPINSQSITFEKNCKPIAGQQNNTKFTISGNLLTLRRFVMRDSGNYKCKGIGPNGAVQEFAWVLHLRVKFTKNTGKRAEYKEKAIDSHVMFDCRSFADKRLFYSHLQTAHATGMSNSRLVRDQNTGLYELKNVALDDTGFYYCGKSELLMHLVVRDRPRVSMSGKSLVKAGENVVLKCNFTGSQAIAWYKGNKKMKGKNRAKGALIKNGYKKRHLNLILSNITPDASGTYRCVAVVDNTTLTSSAIRLDVLEFKKESQVYGDFTTANATLFVLCESNQKENVKYSLLTRPIAADLSSPFKEVKMGHGISEIIPGLYQIDSLSPPQEGYYKCRASLKGVTIERELKQVVWIDPVASKKGNVL